MNATVFLDDFAVESRIGFRRRLFQPTLLPDREYGGPGSSWGRIVGTARSDRFLLYHQWMPDMQEDWARRVVVLEAHSPLSFEPEVIRATRQTAMDGVGGIPNVQVTYDPHDPNPAQRFKSITLDYTDIDHAWGTIATSPDGLSWDAHPEYRFCDHYPDTNSSIHYNEAVGGYVLYYRAALTDRRLHVTTSTDLRRWEQPRVILAPDTQDEPGTQIYGMTVADAGGYWIGLPQIYRTDPRDPVPYKMAGVVDMDVAVSYDGLYWNRAHAEPPIPRRQPGEYGHGGVYGSSIVEDPESGDWIVHTNEPMTQHAFGYKPAYPDTELSDALRRDGTTRSRLYRIRKDGFVGLESFAHRAALTFAAFDLLSANVGLNVRTAAHGWIRFRVTDGSGDPIAGFDFEDSVPFSGDDTHHVPRWKGASLEKLIGRRLRLELDAYEAIVFALRGDFRPHHGYHSQVSWGRPAPVHET